MAKKDHRAATLFAEFESFLAQDDLHHITPLKMLGLFRQHLRVVPIVAGAERAFLMLSPRAVSQWGTAKYPSATLVIFPVLTASPSAAMIESCIRSILENVGSERFVVKSCQPELISALRVALPALNYQRALLTFTPCGEGGVGLANAARVNSAVQVTAHLPPEALALLAAHDVYSASELETMFADGSARCLLSFDGDEADLHPIAIALSFPNAPTLHEIGSLYVTPYARRAGRANALVCTALANIASRNLAMRYVVDATNAPSIALAKRCGLREVMRLEHWLSA